MIEAFADPATGAAPLRDALLGLGLRPRRWRAQLQVGVRGRHLLGRAVTRTYTKPGTYTAKVTATDDEGDKSSKRSRSR